MTAKLPDEDRQENKMEEKSDNNAEPHSAATEVDVEKAATPPPAKAEDEDDFPSGMKVIIIMLAVWLSMFLVALVRSLPSTSTMPR